jgi:hypothetical protein
VKPHLRAAVLVCLLPAAASAQGTGPFGGLFGRTPHRTGLDYEVFEIRGLAGGQWNDYLFDQTPDQPEPPFSGMVSHAAAIVDYDRQSDRFDLRAGSTVEYRNSLTSADFRGTTVDSGVVLNSRLTTRVSAELSANYRRSPFYQFFPEFAWLGEGVAVVGSPYDIKAIGYHIGEARVGGSYQYSKSSTLAASASRGETWFPTAPYNDVTLSDYEGSWTRRLNRDFALRLGYSRREIRHHTVALGNLVEEQINVGVDFHRALTMSPRTTVSFTSHTSVVRQADGKPHYRLNGEFLLTRRFNRTWKLQLDAERATEIVAGVVQPLLADSLSLSMSGQFSNRVEFMTVLRGSHGRFGYEGEQGPFTMAGSLTHVSMGLTRYFGIYGQYGLYHHNAPTAPFSIHTISELSRQTLSFGVTTWLPVHTRERMPIDSR